MYSERDLPSFACRIIMQDGEWAPDAPPELRARHAKPIPYRDVPKVYHPVTPSRRSPQVVAPKEHPVREAPRPVVKPVKVIKPKAERRKPGRAWNKNPAITVERIEAVQREGKTIREIADHFACSSSCIFKRMRLYRRSNPTAAAFDSLKTLCSCGNQKLPSHTTCWYCRQKERKRTNSALRKLESHGEKNSQHGGEPQVL